MKIIERLKALRTEMQKLGIDAWIVSGSDPHQNEYLAPRWGIRAWITGFTGSAGIVVITMKEAGLWTDSRYFIQADEQLKDTGVTLHKMGMPGVEHPYKWLSNNLKDGSVVGFDGESLTYSSFQELKKFVSDKEFSYNYDKDIVDVIWKDRPAIPSEECFELTDALTGETIESKINRIRDKMELKGAGYHVITTLDDIAWITNLRGNDIKFNPVFFSYMIFAPDTVQLFVNKAIIPENLETKLVQAGIELKKYTEFDSALAEIPEDTSILLNSAKVSVKHYGFIKGRIVSGMNISTELKARKNQIELEGMKNAHVKDGAAVVKFMYWLSQNKDKGLTEYDLGVRINEFRAEQEGYFSPSFSPIVGYNANGAIVHYSASKEECAVIKPEGSVLIDTGGQYFAGTTDITRTIALGNVSEKLKRDYTNVLKGHLKLSAAVFPDNVPSIMLDTFAHEFLWETQNDYRHGTGHGVGHFLCVHEGPCSISVRSDKVFLKPGNVLSNEPGCYIEGEYGIRIENLIAVKDLTEIEGKSYYGFDTLTVVPYDRNLIVKELLSRGQEQQINDYHAGVYNTLKSFMNAEELEFLKAMTAAL